MLAMVKERPQALVAGRVGVTVLSAKQAKKLFNLSGSKTSMFVRGWISFCNPWLTVDPATYVFEPLNCDYFVMIYSVFRK